MPLDKFPLINFTSADVRYQSTYRWDRAPFAQDSLGHTIQNSRNITLTAGAQFKKLYDKVPLLKDILRLAPRTEVWSGCGADPLVLKLIEGAVWKSSTRTWVLESDDAEVLT